MFCSSRLGNTHIKSVFLVVGPLRGGGVKPPEPLSSRGGGYPDLSGPTNKKYTFLCVSSLYYKVWIINGGVFPYIERIITKKYYFLIGPTTILFVPLDNDNSCFLFLLLLRFCVLLLKWLVTHFFFFFFFRVFPIRTRLFLVYKMWP